MQAVRKKWKGANLILCFFLMAGACMSLTQGTKNAYAQEEVFRLELVFDTNTGKIKSVNVLEVNGATPSHQTIEDPTTNELYSKRSNTPGHRHRHIKPHPLTFIWGSPGCIKIQTNSGTERICW